MGEKLANKQTNNKEELILDAALKIFEQKGFNAATTNEIAKEAGIAEGTIFRYFKTKKDILRKILVKAIEVMSPIVVAKPIEMLSNIEGKSEKEILRALLKERLSFVSMQLPIIKTVFAEALIHDDVRQTLLDNIILKIKPRFNDFLDKMITNGKFRNVDTECALRLFIGSLLILPLYQHMFNIKYSEKELDRIIDNTIDILLYGLTPINHEGSENL
jgi:AcrR family transcriptional regulator